MSGQGSSQQKTEQPTPRRLQEARKKGQVAKSRDLSAAIILMAVILLFYIARATALASWQEQLAWYFSQCLTIRTPEQSLLKILLDSLFNVFVMFAPVFILIIIMALAANIGQTGFIFSTEALKVKLDRLNPIEGLKKMFSLQSLVELVKNIFKVIIVAVVSYSVIKKYIPELLLVFYRSPNAAFGTVAGVVLAVALAGGGAFLALAVADLFYQRWQHIKNLRMTKQEVKDEFKQTEGDPMIKSWMRRRQREIVLNNIRQQVPKATVVITNPTHLAVALTYKDGEMAAPTVVAKGAGDLARQIRELAAKHEVPIIRNIEVARALYKQVEVGQEIPLELYQAVAQILAMVYRLKKNPYSTAANS